MVETATLLDSTWDTFRCLVNEELERFLCLSRDCPNGLREAMAYSLLAGGKRLRPVLVVLACEACGGEIGAALPAACAIEMVHTYSLIHDDLPAMDDDDLRRGRPTNHVVFGEATAVLSGDALLTFAFETLATNVQPPEVAAACCADLAAAAGPEGMVAGQFADLEAEGRIAPSRDSATGEPAPEIETLRGIHRRKTGRLLTCALSLGARIAQADVAIREALAQYGRCIGLAFQITDDLLDVLGDEVTIGKGVQKDAGHGKLTYPGLLGIEESRAQAQALVDEACRSLAPLGERGRRLEALAHFVLERDH